MRVKSMLLAAVMAAGLLLTGCGARPLPEGIDEAAAGQAGEAIVELMLAGDRQGVIDAFDPAVRENLSLAPESLEPLLVPIQTAGNYVSTYKVMAVGGKSNDYDGEYITVGVYCEHEKIDVVYEMSFDMELELLGLQTKQQRRSLFGN